MSREDRMIVATDGDALVRGGPSTAYPPIGNPVAEPDDPAVPYRALHQLLRGRYRLAISLGLLLAGGLGLCGWMLVKPLYRSEALVRIAYEIPRLSTSDSYKPMEVFEAFMQSQQAMIASHGVISEAMKDPVWAEKQYRLVNTDGFAGDLKVEHKGGTEHLKLSYSSTDPQFAALAVNSIVNAYTRRYQSENQQSSSAMNSTLENQRAQLRQKVDQLEANLREESIEFGSSNVDRFYDSAVQGLTKVESTLFDVKIALALTQGSGENGTAMRYTPQQIARFDGTMARYMAEREQLEMELEKLRLRGYGEGHKQISQVHGSLEMVGNRIRDYAREFQGARAPASVPPPAMAGAGNTIPQTNLAGRSAGELRADEANLSKLIAESKTQVATLGSKKLKVEAIRAEIEKNKTDLTEVSQKLTLLQMEKGLGGRMSVMSTGEVPLLPFRDRRPHAAAAGAMGGFVLPAALIAAWSAGRRRYRYSNDATGALDADIPLLGILPELPARLTEPEYAADAAQCVHQIRVMLQVHAPSGGSCAYLMTSACPGEGKTSLTAALALSFAGTGARTLLVDADLIGQRLTRGYQMEEREGFREAISGDQTLSIYPTAMANLSMMPAGISDGRDACSISTGAVKRILGQLRRQYDVILIDSGPILGSLEALVVAGQVDGVVLTISREQQKPLVDRAIRQLKSVGARIAGMVFNKAQSWDFKRSVGMSSLRSVSRNPEMGLVKAGVTSTSGFGSLVDSVQTYMPSST